MIWPVDTSQYDCVKFKIISLANTTYLYRAKPILKKMPGWKSDITGIRKFEDLPQACQDYVNEIERQIQCPITMVSNGPAREDIIPRKPLI